MRLLEIPLTPTAPEPSPAAILRNAARVALRGRVISQRDHRVNPGGLIRYVATDREAMLQLAELDARDFDPSGVAASVVQGVKQDKESGFWSCEMRWRSCE